MRAIIIERFGDPSGLRPTELPAPTAGADQVVVEVEAIGVGGVDAVIRRGTLGSAFPTGMVPGSEIAGRVVALGAGVERSWLGRRVWAFTGTGGAYAEQAAAALGDVVALPDELSATDAVTLGSAGTVAHFALEHAHLAAGESVLVRGAAGSIGIAAVELATARGAAAVAVTTSSAERGERLRVLGATHVLDRSGAGKDAPPAFDVVVDIVGGADVASMLARLAPNGRYVLVGVVGGFPPPDFASALLRDFRQSLSFATFSLDSVPVAARDEVRTAQFAAVAAGRGLTPVVQDVLPLDRAADAHSLLDSGSAFGRFVLVP